MFCTAFWSGLVLLVLAVSRWAVAVRVAYRGNSIHLAEAYRWFAGRGDLAWGRRNDTSLVPCDDDSVPLPGGALMEGQGLEDETCPRCVVKGDVGACESPLEARVPR